MTHGRNRLGTVLVCLFLSVLAGCHPDPGTPTAEGIPPAVPVGSSEQTLQIGGTARTFRVYRPASLPDPVSLVVMLHGGFGSADQAESSYGWNAEADRERFVVAYPEGLHRAWAVGGGCCGVPGSTNVDDVAFIEAVVADLSGRLPVDARRVYATGISNGGMMSYRLGCDSRVFAAIGPDSATLLGSCPTPAPVSVIHIHGLADNSVRFNGGPGDGVAKINGPAVPSVIDLWRTADGCAPASVATAGPVTTSTASCPDGRVVELVTVAGAGHQWPGAEPKPMLQKVLGTDPPSDALSATDTIWRFFAAHPRLA